MFNVQNFTDLIAGANPDAVFGLSRDGSGVVLHTAPFTRWIARFQTGANRTVTRRFIDALGRRYGSEIRVKAVLANGLDSAIARGRRLRARQVETIDSRAREEQSMAVSRNETLAAAYLTSFGSMRSRAELIDECRSKSRAIAKEKAAGFSVCFDDAEVERIAVRVHDAIIAYGQAGRHVVTRDEAAAIRDEVIENALHAAREAVESKPLERSNPLAGYFIASRRLRDCLRDLGGSLTHTLGSDGLDRSNGNVALSRPGVNTMYAQANGIELAYADTGDSAPAMVLIRGLGTQLIDWSDELIGGLRQRGLRVITFDNRDAGCSSKLEKDYPLRAMADDVVGLLDFLAVGRAHVFGISLGGMVAQLVAHHHPNRVLTLCSVMSSSGNPDLPPMDERVRQALIREAQGREAIVRVDAGNRNLIGSPSYPESVEERLVAARAAYDRCYCPEGVARQMRAAISDGSRVERLKTIESPTLVIHGADDVLLPPACGEDTARWIPGAELAIVAGMGHNIPESLAPRIVELVGDFIRHRSVLP